MENLWDRNTRDILELPNRQVEFSYRRAPNAESMMQITATVTCTSM